MMNRISDGLASIEAGLRQLNRERLLGLLQPGLGASCVERRFAETSFAGSNDLVELYLWRNGVPAQTDAPLGKLWMFPGFYFPSLEESFANYLTFKKDPRWGDRWFPVFADGGGDFYAVESSSEGRWPVRHFRIAEHEHPVEYESLEKMVCTIAAAYDQGIFFVDLNGSLELFEDRFDELAREMNPGVAWWRD